MRFVDLIALQTGRAPLEPPSRMSLEAYAEQLGVSVFHLQDPNGGSVFEVAPKQGGPLRSRFEVSAIEQASLSREALGRIVAERLTRCAAELQKSHEQVVLGEEAARFLDALRFLLGAGWVLAGWRRVERVLVTAALEGAGFEVKIEFGPEDWLEPRAAADRIRLEAARLLGV